MSRTFKSALYGKESEDMAEAFMEKPVFLIDQVSDPFSGRFREQLANVMGKLGVIVKYGNEVQENGWHLVIVSGTNPAVVSCPESIYAKVYLEEYQDEYQDTFSIDTAAVRNLLYELLIREEIRTGVLSYLSAKLCALVRDWSFAVFEEDSSVLTVLRVHEGGFIEWKRGESAKEYRSLYKKEEKNRVLCLLADDEGNKAVIVDTGTTESVPGKQGKKASSPECNAAKLAEVHAVKTRENDGAVLYTAVPEDEEFLGTFELCVHELRAADPGEFDDSSVFQMIQTAEVISGKLYALPFPIRIILEYYRRQKEESA